MRSGRVPIVDDESHVRDGVARLLCGELDQATRPFSAGDLGRLDRAVLEGYLPRRTVETRLR